MKNPDSGTSTGPRICIFSQRNLHKEIFRCLFYEFEDVIGEIEEVELIAPKPYRSFVIGERIMNQLARHISIACLNPGVRELRLRRSYDLFVAICMFPKDLLSLNAIKGWRKRCQTSICWLGEIWSRELHRWKGHLNILSKFDYVVLNCSASVRAVQETIQRPCFYIPPGVDTIRFCPYPNPSPQNIDVYSIGRKSPVVHQSLLKMAEQKEIFYIYDTYDTIYNLDTFNYRQHRSLVANIAKRSRYFLVNLSKIDRKFERGSQGEIGSRFFEGAASGTVMIGQPPENEDFSKYFHWPDAVIHMDFDSPDIAEVLADLDLQRDRLKEVRRNNVVQSLLRHDWVYRWREILDIVGFKPRPAVIARAKRLKKLAEEVKKAYTHM